MFQDYVLGQLSEKGYGIVQILFTLVDRRVLAESERFAKWFCAVVGHKLGIKNQVETTWEPLLANNFNITNYFEFYILKARVQLLVLDDMNIVFG